MDNSKPRQNAHEQPSTNNYTNNHLGSPSAIELREEQLRLKREERRQARLRNDLILDKLNSAIHFVIIVLEVLLGFRFLLQLTQANRENIFASFIYELSEPFVSPFSNLFNHGEQINLFDGGLLVAMIVYGMLGIMLKWLIGFLRN